MLPCRHYYTAASFRCYSKAPISVALYSAKNSCIIMLVSVVVQQQQSMLYFFKEFIQSEQEGIVFGIPQKSILAPFLFNIFLCVFLFLNIKSVGIAIAILIIPLPILAAKKTDLFENLETATNETLKRLNENLMKVNTDKFNRLLNTKEDNYSR